MPDAKRDDATPERNPREADTNGTSKPSPAGPHDTPELTNPIATPGSGTLPSPRHDDEADGSSG